MAGACDQPDTRLLPESVLGALAADPYFISHQPRALLCAPVLKHGSVVGVLYLESSNNAHAFAAARVLLLQLLCSQASRR